MIREHANVQWRKKGSGFLPPLPNADSPHKTASTFLLDIHYSNLRIAERWDLDRFDRLCSFLKVTRYELASLVLCPHSWVEKLVEHNRIPCCVSGGGRAVALLLCILEAKVLRRLVPDVIEDPMPNLNAILKQRR